MLTADGLRDRLEDFEHGADLGDRDRADQRVTLSLTCCAMDDREQARELARQHVAFDIGGMGTFYRDALARQGRGHRLDADQSGGNKRAAVEAISDERRTLADAARPRTGAPRRLRLDAVAAVDSRSPALQTETLSTRPSTC